MKSYLVNKGIDEERILEENNSYNSDTNIKYSKQIIDEKELSTDVVIITDAYHQYRSSLYAKKYGLNSKAYSSWCDFTLQQPYWIREMIGLMKFWILDS